MSRAVAGLAATLLVGCLNVVTINSAPDAAAPVVCAGTSCAPGEVCCLLTGRCFDPATQRASCAIPEGGNLGSLGDPGQAACVSNADCRADELCAIGMHYYQGCLGVGVCRRRGPVGTCFDDPRDAIDECEVCGCDGVTYPNGSVAAAAGVNSHGGRCGQAPRRPGDAGPGAPRLSTIPCGLTSQCPVGAACCAITGYCYDPACPGCCQVPPRGTAGPCERSSDCPEVAPMCEGGPACDSPGFCVTRRGGCGGAVATVCGCDGVTYSNDCWAQHALTRVAHVGPCP